MTHACILCIIVVLKFQPSIGNVEVENKNNRANEIEQGSPLDAIKRGRGMMRNMLEQHALRLRRGGFNSGFSHALRVRRAGGIGQRSSWGHALRVRSSNMLNRGHALRIKRKLGSNDYRAFALRVKKDDDNELNDAIRQSLNGQDFSAEAIHPDVEGFENDYEKRSYYDPEMDADDNLVYYGDEMMPTKRDAGDLFKHYYRNQRWLFPSRKLRSASFAHVLRV